MRYAELPYVILGQFVNLFQHYEDKLLLSSVILMSSCLCLAMFYPVSNLQM